MNYLFDQVFTQVKHVGLASFAFFNHNYSKKYCLDPDFKSVTTLSADYCLAQVPKCGTD